MYSYVPPRHHACYNICPFGVLFFQLYAYRGEDAPYFSLTFILISLSLFFLLASGIIKTLRVSLLFINHKLLHQQHPTSN